MCLTEAASNEANFIDTDRYESNYKPFHKFTGHGLTIYQTSKIFSVEEFSIISSNEILPVLFRAGDTHILINQQTEM